MKQILHFYSSRHFQKFSFFSISSQLFQKFSLVLFSPPLKTLKDPSPAEAEASNAACRHFSRKKNFLLNKSIFPAFLKISFLSSFFLSTVQGHLSPFCSFSGKMKVSYFFFFVATTFTALPESSNISCRGYSGLNKYRYYLVPELC